MSGQIILGICCGVPIVAFGLMFVGVGSLLLANSTLKIFGGRR